LVINAKEKKVEWHFVQNDRRHQCPMCAKAFKHAHSVKIHIKHFHEKLRPFGENLLKHFFFVTDSVAASINAQVFGPGMFLTSLPYICG
jgi:hypothetical protein